MSTRVVLTAVGTVIGAYFGNPQLGFVLGSLVGGIADPGTIPGPKLGELAVQTSADGVPRTIIYGTIDCYGNIIQTGQAIKIEGEDGGGKGEPEQGTGDQALRTFAVRICEGPIAAVLRVWEDNKLVYDARAGSGMVAESQKWMENKVLYLGGEDQLPDPTLVSSLNPDTPAYRGSAYMVFVLENQTERAGSTSQYRWEVSRAVTRAIGSIVTGPSNSVNAIPYLDVDDQSRPTMMRDQAPSSSQYIVGNPGTWNVTTYSTSDINTTVDSQVYSNGGDPLSPSTDQRLGLMAADYRGYGVANGVNYSMCRLLFGGTTKAHLNDENGSTIWGGDEGASGVPPQYGGLIWFYENSVYIGTMRSSYNRLTKHALSSVGEAGPSAYILGVVPTGNGFYMHVSRQGVVRSLELTTSGRTYLKEYDENLVQTGTRGIPSSGFLSANISEIYCFGVDDAHGYQVYVYKPPGLSVVRVDVYDTSDNFVQTQDFSGNTTSRLGSRVVFSDSAIYIQKYQTIYKLDIGGLIGGSSLLSDIVSDVHDRCGISPDGYDVSELSDEVAGFGLAGDYTGASAIDSLRQVYFFDKSEHDLQLWYPKRGAAVVQTLTIDDLTEVPDTTKREQAIEVPKKLHLKYKHAVSGYAPVKSTSPMVPSPDFLTTGEAMIEIPVVLDENQAAQAVDKMYKVARAEMVGTTEVIVPVDIGAKFVPGNCIGLSLRGQVTRQRIEQMDYGDGVIKLTLRADRQSAYTSILTGIPIPPPTLPPSTIVGDTELAVMDIPARVDSEDSLGIVIAVDGALPPWYGAVYQRSLDGGATYTTVAQMNTASIMGVLLNDVSDASEHVTDYTNTVRVQLYRENHSIDSITDAEFLSEGGGFALEKSDGSWELLQARDWLNEGSQVFVGSVLHRGLLNSGTESHEAGMRLVMIQRPTFFPMQASWLGTDVTHRAISLGESADDTDNDVTQQFEGRSQREWPVTQLVLTRNGTDITATWDARHRFGSDISPVASINFQGFRVTLDDGVLPSVTFSTTVNGFTDYDASSLGSPLTVSIQPINRITGLGPATSGAV